MRRTLAAQLPQVPFAVAFRVQIRTLVFVILIRLPVGASPVFQGDPFDPCRSTSSSYPRQQTHSSSTDFQGTTDRSLDVRVHILTVPNRRHVTNVRPTIRQPALLVVHAQRPEVLFALVVAVQVHAVVFILTILRFSSSSSSPPSPPAAGGSTTSSSSSPGGAGAVLYIKGEEVVQWAQ